VLLEGLMNFAQILVAVVVVADYKISLRDMSFFSFKIFYFLLLFLFLYYVYTRYKIQYR